MMYGYGDGSAGSWWMVAGGVLWLALIALAVVAIVMWMRRSAGSAGSTSARHILSERFARGEIDADELEARRKALAKR